MKLTPSRPSVLRLSLENGVMAHLSVSAYEPIVVLERARFLVAWARCHDVAQRRLATADATFWRADRKFQHAADGFSHGLQNPVPIATVELIPARGAADHVYQRLVDGFVGGSRDDDQLALCFVDGVTRTIWLLANGARVLPFACSEARLDTIEALAGADALEATNFLKSEHL